MNRWLAGFIGFLLVVNVTLAQKTKQIPLDREKSVKSARQQMNEHTDDLRALMLTLYEQHPEELTKSTQVGPREMTEWVFDGKANWKFDGLRRKQSMQAIALVFDPGFSGDHILALVVGIETLLFEAYGGINEFDIPVSQDQQKLMSAKCALKTLSEAISSQAVLAERVKIFESTASKQEIQRILQTIINRMPFNNGTHSDRACL